MHAEVSFWEEYHDYTLEDAVSSLGGILNIVTFAYFWVAYYIAVNLGHHSYEMGILPEMSFVFSNLEKILLIKECLEKNSIIPQSSRWFGRAIASDSEKCTLPLATLSEDSHKVPSLLQDRVFTVNTERQRVAL